MSFLDKIFSWFRNDDNTVNQSDIISQQLDDDALLQERIIQQINDDNIQQDIFNQQIEDIITQQVEHEMNPYERPGMDTVVDETYFGMDEGLGISNPDIYEDINNDSYLDDSWSNDSFSDDSYMGDSYSDDSWSDDSYSDDSWTDDSWTDDSWSGGDW